MLPAPFDSLDDRFKTAAPFERGDHVFRQGDESRGVFFVASGRVCLTRVTESGAPVTVHIAGAGEMFAEASLYSDVYHCDAVCVAPARLICVAHHAILARQKQDAAFSEALARRLAGQVQDYRQLLTLHAVKSASERVLLAVSLGKLTGSVTQFASQIGLTREACYRALRELTDQGALTKLGRGRYAPAPRGKG